MAAAMNGAVQGVARTVVTTPFKKAPSGPSFAAADWTEPLPKKPGIGTSQTPSRLSAIANTTAAIVTLNEVLPNWPPQERPSVAASSPSSRNTEIMPAANQRFSMNACARLLPACSTKLITLRPITGNTHGIRLRISPPTNASAM